MAGGAPAAVCSQAGAKHGTVGVTDPPPGESGHGPCQAPSTTLKSSSFLSFSPGPLSWLQHSDSSITFVKRDQDAPEDSVLHKMLRIPVLLPFPGVISLKTGFC